MNIHQARRHALQIHLKPKKYSLNLTHTTMRNVKLIQKLPFILAV